MHAPSNPVLLVIAAVGLAVAGCASQPKEDQSSRVANKPACAEDPSNPLHLTTLRKKEALRDPQLESLLYQSGDPRLQQINREMYQTLRSLDAELRREQQVAACKRGDSDIRSLQTQSTPDSGSGSGVGSAGSSGGGAVAAGGPNAAGGAGAVATGGLNAAGGGAGGFALGGTAVAASTAANSAAGSNAGSTANAGAVANARAAVNAGSATNAGAAASATSSAGLAAAGTGTVAANARTTLIRKASVPPTTSGGGGNGATAQKVSAGSDNDIVARRLRRAAEQETDPAVKAKLWKEYAQYQQGISAK